MKEFRFRLILIVGVFALSLYLLYPTYQDYLNSDKISKVLEEKEKSTKQANPSVSKAELQRTLKRVEDSLKTADPSIRDARAKRIKLGLDLQGGMRVVLEVNTAQLLGKLANNPDDKFRTILKEAQEEADREDVAIVSVLVRKLAENNIRLSRYFGSVREDDAKIVSDLETQTEDAVLRAEEIIRNRVDQYGVAEPSIQRQGNRRIIVELPGIANEEEARQLIQSTALLEFRLVKDPQFAFGILQNINNVMAGIEVNTDSAKTDTTKAANDSTVAANKDTAKTNQTAQNNENPLFKIIQPLESGDALIKETDKAKFEEILSRPEIQRVVPDNIDFLFSAKPMNFVDGEGVYSIICVNKNAELTGGVITEAVGNIDPNSSKAIVTMAMNSEGSLEWARITGANIKKRIAIVLDGVVYSAPVVNNKITGGRSQIEGMADLNEAKNLAIILNAGAFSAPVEVIEERTVGPSLGEDSVNSGFMSALLGYLLVAGFMIFYYQKSGSIAAVALFTTILFILGVLAGFGATLTLPGIAGIVLTIGMAVDANVLIFERIREELDSGKTTKAALEGGFSKAYSAIWDSNITTLITGIVLYQFGTGPIQGFALTLMIGLATSLFGALVITKMIMELSVSKGAKISIG
ncbi:MAG: protein translocase subunit SecD [Ignavibacteriaceae bacterium]|nr:protein translocase subunit SecD [Ignavibacteriaceae bacterium]